MGSQFLKCKRAFTFLIAFAFPVFTFSQTVGVFYDKGAPKIEFAAADIIKAIESKYFIVEELPLSSLTILYTHNKIVINLVSDNTTVAQSILTRQ